MSEFGTSKPPFIVGVGTSAGGLEALEHFLRPATLDCGLAFVVVQHLDPTRKGLLPELLAHLTCLPVQQARDRQKVQPNNVYVIPPNRDLAIRNGALQLKEPEAPRGLRLPIDYFFRSLASDQHEHAVGVILSGMGSDGAVGLREIKANGGLVLVQEPATAKFDGMPRSAVQTGQADIVAPAGELVPRILAYCRRPLLVDRMVVEAPAVQGVLDKVLTLLRTRTGHDFSLYKRSTICRRIERRMGVHQVDHISTYLRLLQGNSQEVDLLFRELLIGVTTFFRDPTAWQRLSELALPALVRRCARGGTLRAWVAGCSTGEEAYSLAICLREAVQALKLSTEVGVQVFATDLDPDAIARARAGRFPLGIAAAVSASRLAHFFQKDDHGYQIRKEVRDEVVFAVQNVAMDPPFTKIDLLTCRNVMIYFDQRLQHRLLPLFHYSLRPGGVLFLGSAETASGFSSLFTPLDVKARICLRSEAGRGGEVSFPSRWTPPSPAAPEPPRGVTAVGQAQKQAEQLLLQQFTPAAVLVNEQGDILYVSGRTGPYLEPAAGKANWNVLAMAREELRHDLRTAFAQALRQAQAVTRRHQGPARDVTITVQPIQASADVCRMVLVVFREVEPPASAPSPGRRRAGRAQDRTRSAPRVSDLQRHLAEARQELQAAQEEMQTSQEELQSTNEELQSTNEELQSTNEELTTSKEELQSLNEELQTINVEPQSKVDDLSRTSNDMKNLLNSTDIATVFLDNELRVQRFTPQAATIIKLIPGDVGRPVTDLASGLRYPEMKDHATEVLRTLIPEEHEALADDGRWFTVRILPYRTHDNLINGVVITFVDVTAAKALEADLRRSQATLRALVEASGTVVLCLSPEGRIVEFNPAAEALLGWRRDEVIDRGYLDALIPPSVRDRVAAEMARILSGAPQQEFTCAVRTRVGRECQIRWTASQVRDHLGRVSGMIAVGQALPTGDAPASNTAGPA